MVNEREEPRDREPRSWRIRRWAAPIAMALSVAASIGAVQLLADEEALSSGAPPGDGRDPRFRLIVGRIRTDALEDGPAPWFRVEAIRRHGQNRLVDSVHPPSASAGEAREILAGPEGMFVVSSTRDEPCESRLYRFTLTRDGQVRRIAPLTEDAVPARVGGLAMSPDGDKIAYTTAPCGDDLDTAPPPRADVTVLDIGSGLRRAWSTSGPAVVGQIVWAGDGRTLGYLISDVRPDADPAVDFGNGGPNEPSGNDIGNATLHALDTGAQGTDLRAGRVLFRETDASVIVTSALMGLDGRTGYGVMQKGSPASTILFTFAEGEPMHVTDTLPPAGQRELQLVVLGGSGHPRYACSSGVDPFGRVSRGDFRPPSGLPLCEMERAY